MSISFACPTCGRRFDVPDHLEGKQARCQTCGQVVTISGAAARGTLGGTTILKPAPLVEVEPVDREAQVGVPVAGGSGFDGSVRRGIHPAVVMAIAGGAAAIVALLVLLVALLFSGGGGSNDRASHESPAGSTGTLPSRIGQERPPVSQDEISPTSASSRGASGRGRTFSPVTTELRDPSLRPSQVRAVDVGEKRIVDVLFASGLSRAVVTQVDKTRVPDRQVATLYDLEAGRSIGKLELSEYTKVLAVTPDATTMVIAATHPTRHRNKLALWKWQDGSAKLLQKIIPPGEQVVKWARFLTPPNLLLPTSHDKAAAFDIIEVQPKYSVQAANNQPPVFSPGGRWMASYTGGSVPFLDSSTGEVAATFKTDSDTTLEYAACSFSPDGTRFVLLVRSYVHDRYIGYCWDLRTRRLLSKAWLPYVQCRDYGHPAVWWCGTDYLMIEDRLWHLDSGLYVWRYAPAYGQVSQDRVWLNVNEFGHNHLVPVELPLAADRTQIESEVTSVRPLLSRGDSIRVEVRGAQNAPSRSFADELSAAVTDQLQAKEYRVGRNAPLCLRLSISEKTEGEPIEFESFIGEGEPFSVPDRVLYLKMELFDSNGKAIWQHEDEYRVSAMGLQRLRTKDPAGQLLNQRWDSMIWWAKRFEFPDVIYDPALEDGFGSTELTLAKLGETTGAGTEGGGEELARQATIGSVWKYERDATPSPTKEFVKRRLKLSEGRLFDARFAGPETGQVAVLMRLISDDGQLSLERSVQRLDLANSQILGSFAVPANAELLDFRLDGRVIAIKLTNDSNRAADRLEVWNCSGQGDKRILNCVPYQDYSSKKIGWAAFVGTKGLLTRGEYSHSVELWQLPECNELASIAWEGNVLPALSAQRKYMAVPRKGFIEILDTDDLSLAGRLLSDFVVARDLSGGAFDPDGQRFAAIAGGFSEKRFILWDLEQGRLVKQFPIGNCNSSDRTSHRWIDKRYYYAGGYLIDVEEETVVWQYDHENCIGATPDGRFWYGAVGREDRPYLCATEVPSRQVRSAMERALTAGLLVGPGLSVSIKTLTKGNPSADACQQITDAVKQALTERGIQVGGGLATLEITLTNEVYERARAAGYPTDPEIKRRILSVTLRLVDSQGRFFWHAYKSDFVNYKASGGLREGEELPWKDFAAWVGTQIPKKFYHWRAQDAPGKSKLVYDGEEIRSEYSGK